VANLEGTLREAPVAELERALSELGDAKTPDARRADLREFVDLAAREFASLVGATVEEIVSVAQQVDHVQKILSDQENVSRAARVLQPVAIGNLVSESVSLLGSDLQQAIQITLDSSLQEAGQVLGSRVALQQILINLLKNAAESIRSRTTAPPIGMITVAATAESRDNRKMVRLCVTDNGAGIAPGNQPRLFERGFSTKSRASSGQGLHWCAVTAAALNGHMDIDSPGIGRGATVSLWLPQA
jgi:signal transduction histidine kinase